MTRSCDIFALGVYEHGVNPPNGYFDEDNFSSTLNVICSVNLGVLYCIKPSRPPGGNLCIGRAMAASAAAGQQIQKVRKIPEAAAWCGGFFLRFRPQSPFFFLVWASIIWGCTEAKIHLVSKPFLTILNLPEMCKLQISPARCGGWRWGLGKSSSYSPASKDQQWCLKPACLSNSQVSRGLAVLINRNGDIEWNIWIWAYEPPTDWRSHPEKWWFRQGK